MRTDWKNYRQLKEGEIIQSYDQCLTADGQGQKGDGDWDEVSSRRVGQPAPCPQCPAHTMFRRPIHLENDKDSHAK